MYSDFNFDAQINLPDYIMGCVDKFDEESTTEKQQFKQNFLGENEYEKQFLTNPNQKDYSFVGSDTVSYAKRLNPIVEIMKLKEDEEAIIDEVLDSSSENNPDSKQSENNAKINKKKQIAKKYRQKKKEYIKSLEEENRFLRQKVDDLSFRFHETENQVNRLKHGTSTYTNQFQPMKQTCLKEAQQILSQQNSTLEQINEVQTRLQNIISFNGKQKIKTLNYFMSQLLENAVEDKAIYFQECLMSKRGIYRQNKQVELRRMDLQIMQIFQSQGKESGEEFFQRQISQVLVASSHKFKNYWQKIYLYYLKLLNEGFIIDSMVQSFKEKIKDKIQMSIPLKIELYFEKIKYRKDMRQLRATWFKELNTDQEIKNEIERITCLKRVKV